MKITANATACATVMSLALLAPNITHAEQIGTSCADCPNYSGAYSIENSTGVSIPYQFRWGSSQPWRSIRLASGRVETHSYPLGADKNKRVPTPYVRFDRIGGDNMFTAQEYKMKFYAVGYAGYGPGRNTTEPKRYIFRYAADGRSLDIKEK